MSEHCEEQEMEAEALEAIFMESFEILSDSQPFKWSVKLVPVDCGGDEEEEEAQNHVAIKLLATIPLDYPDEGSLPELDVEVVKGLAQDQVKEILALANEEAEANAGMPAIFAVCEAVRAWLAENNVKGLDDGSMHAQMMRKKKEAEKAKAKKVQQFEAQKETQEMSLAEKEEIEVRKRRAEGTPCNEENFYAWLQRFEEEKAQKAAEEEAKEKEAAAGGKKKSAEKKDETKDRLTGFEQFSGKVGIMSLEAIEAAAEEAENEEGDGLDDDDLEGLDEDLFDDDDDLDDLDFDSDEDDSDEEEEPNI